MKASSKTCFDVSTGIDVGARDYQEDCLVADFPMCESYGIGVLADGMGAHASGDMASALVVSQVFAALKMRRNMLKSGDANIPALLKKAVGEANTAMSNFIKNNPDSKGMGATLIATVVRDNQLYWLSVGDSPLYLIRNGEIQKLNEDHSMAPQIDAMVASGQLSAEVAAQHPDRNCLTSAVLGEEIPRIDCPETPMALEPDDILILASDGLQTLTDGTILKLANKTAASSSAVVTQNLMSAVEAAAMPEQDNISVMVLQIDQMPVMSPEPKTERRIETQPVHRSAEEDAILAALVPDIEEAPDIINQAMAL
ncbi:protein phosphatase 2C domain-containing protein [Ruegeria sp. SCPT10]|uniref:PP2C family protein-serine/threonine phosphatase n=1 Tax=Ruegeria sp. SCP10 TaxID=3141377 RepID=UPI0033370FCA